MPLLSNWRQVAKQTCGYFRRTNTNGANQLMYADFKLERLPAHQRSPVVTKYQVLYQIVSNIVPILISNSKWKADVEEKRFSRF